MVAIAPKPQFRRGKGGTIETVLTYAAIGAIAFVVTGKSATIEKGTELVD